MKKAISLLLALVLCLSLCACGSQEESQDPQLHDVDLNIPTKNAPSNDLIMGDLKGALQSKNEYATLTGVETIKSLTNDGTYSITLAVTAETKYADWAYEADMSYTKYDQGWMMDSIRWNSESYVVARYPEDDVMTAYVNNYFASFDGWIINELVPIENGFIEKELVANAQTHEYETVDVPSSDQLIFGWNAAKQLRHGEYTASYRSAWQYAPDIDEWVLMKAEDSHSYHGYQIYIAFDDYTLYDVDFSGTYESDFGTVAISNYSKDAFDVALNDGELIHFVKSSTSPTGGRSEGTRWYIFEDSNRRLYASFEYNETSTKLTVINNYYSTVSLLFYVNISEDLPLLQQQ